MGYVDEVSSYLGRIGVTTLCGSRAFVDFLLNFVKVITANRWLELNSDCEQHDAFHNLTFFFQVEDCRFIMQSARTNIEAVVR